MEAMVDDDGGAAIEGFLWSIEGATDLDRRGLQAALAVAGVDEAEAIQATRSQRWCDEGWDLGGGCSARIEVGIAPRRPGHIDLYTRVDADTHEQMLGAAAAVVAEGAIERWMVV